MALTTVVGKSGAELEVDPTFLAARVVAYPLEYATQGRVLGHYGVVQRSGSLVATIGALGHLASLRWNVSNAYCVLMRLKVAWSIVGAVTAAVQMNMRAVLARGFTVDFSADNTQANLAAIPKANAMKSSMGSSLLGATGPQIAATTVMSGQTITADTLGIGFATWPGTVDLNATGTAVVMGVGFAVEAQTLYEYNVHEAHPVVLGLNEGIIVQPISAGPASGTYSIYTQWEWAEVEVY